MKTISWTLFLLLLVLVGCTNKEENVKLLQGRTWQLKTMSFEGKTVQIPEKSPDLQFSDSSAFYGFAGCNRFFGKYDVKEQGDLTIHLGGATMMSCPDMDFEQIYLNAISKVERYTVGKKELVLKDSKGKLNLQYTLKNDN
jgi:heat shock protein HslJ